MANKIALVDDDQNILTSVSLALEAEGLIGLSINYANIHLLPMYQKKIAYGKKHFPWSIGRKEISYKKGICPNAENIEDNEFIALMLQEFDFSNSDIEIPSYIDSKWITF